MGTSSLDEYEKFRWIKKLSSCLAHRVVILGFFGPHQFQGFKSSAEIDCEQSLFFFRISEGSARERERRAAKPRDVRNEGGSPRRKKRVSLFSCLSNLAPLVTRVVICVSRTFCSTDQRKKRDCS